MTDNESKAKPRVTDKGADRASQKEQRLAAALRENLKRRKSQKTPDTDPDQDNNDGA